MTTTTSRKIKPGKVAIASAKELQQRALEALCTRAKPLQTEKDGRRHAIAMLTAFTKEVERDEHGGQFSHWSAEAEGADHGPRGEGTVMVYRKGPQLDTLARWFGDLYARGTASAIAGFHVVLTDYIGGAISGGFMDMGVYGRKAAKFPPAGSTIYSAPKAARAAVAKGESAYSIRPTGKAPRR